MAAALSLPAIITSAIAQPAEVTRMFDCSAFTHVLWACLPPSDARDSADGMASAFMSEAIRLGRERPLSHGKVNAAAIAGLPRPTAPTRQPFMLGVPGGKKQGLAPPRNAKNT